MQYIVSPENKLKRDELYEYLDKNNYNFVDDKEYYVDSNFPFVIEENKRVWICNSITCCACAAQAGQIINTEEYFKKVKNHLDYRTNV